MEKFKKVILFFAGSVAIILVMALLLLQPLSSYLISKYSVKYTGRQITADGVMINPFTGVVNLNNLKIYEYGSDSVFFSAEAIYTRISVSKLFRKTTEIKRLSFYHPRGVIVKNDKISNYDDLISRFASQNDSTETDSATTKKRFSILDIRIIDGEFFYKETKTAVDYSVKKVNIESSGKRWDSDTVNLKFSFVPGTGGGDVRGNLTINLKNTDYRIDIQAKKFDLGIIAQSLRALTNYGRFSANIDADIKATGNIQNKNAISTTGLIAINDFHFGKDSVNDFVSFEKLSLSINRVNPANFIYDYDSVSLINPYIKYERYDYLDNVQRVFGKDGSNIESAKNNTEKFNLVIEIARNIKVISANFFRSNYKINSLRIYGGHIKFNDFSTSEKFAMDLTPINISVDSISKDQSRVNMSLKSSIKPFGSLSVYVSVNPKDTTDFDLQYHINKLPASMFNPYTISYTSFPLDRGTMELNGDWRVRNGNIQSKNHFVIVDPRTTRRIRNKDTKWIPVPLIMSFVRERGNVIDYEIPITGNLKDPKFHLMNVIKDLLTNIFVKPPSTPYRLQVKNIENEIEKSISLKWQMRQNALFPEQKEFVEKITDFLVKKPEATLEIHPNQYARKEKEYILFYEAKKKFYAKMNNNDPDSLSSDDIEKIDKMSVKDSLFVDYLNHHLKDSLIFTIQEKCYNIIDSSIVNSKFVQLLKDREESFLSNFKKFKVDDRVKIAKSTMVIPYNGFSFYKIDYKGEYPEILIKAYQKINDLNNKAPRKKFKKERSSPVIKASGQF